MHKLKKIFLALLAVFFMTFSATYPAYASCYGISGPNTLHNVKPPTASKLKTPLLDVTLGFIPEVITSTEPIIRASITVLDTLAGKFVTYPASGQTDHGSNFILSTTAPSPKLTLSGQCSLNPPRIVGTFTTSNGIEVVALQ